MSVTSNQGTSESAPLLPSSLRRNNSFVNAEARGISPVVAERRDSVTIRRPVQYYSVNRDVGPNPESHDDNTQATLSRYKYYSKLAAPAEDRETALLMPHHVVPSNFFVVIPIRQEGGKQSSIITIFSIWNTMMGTSVLSMPWALEQAGFACGIAIIVIMSGITLYTAYRVMNSIKTLGPLGEQEGVDFPDVCRYWLGRWGEYVGIAFSIITLLGAAVVYWVLMANFLYNSVTFVYEEARHEMNSSKAIVIGNISITDAFCPNPPSPPVPPPLPPTTTTTITASPITTAIPPSFNATVGELFATEQVLTDSKSSSIFAALREFYANPRDATFNKVWQQTLTVPFVLVVLLGPLVNFKSPTFFTKFNALGTFSILYILTFVAVKAGFWGIHIDFTNVESDYYVKQFQWTFPALTGTLSLALFIHNCVISIMRTQRNPENNGRDLSIAYFCVAFTYVFIGVLFYTTFPLPKGCIEDNLLNNFHSSDIMSFVARLFLFFQMVTVFPLLMYILRAQTLSYLFGNVYPSWKHVVVVNAVVLTICVIFAIFLPQIGTIIRFSGAICGLAYIFALPCLVHMLSLQRRGKLTWPMLIIHSVLIAVGVANFIAQFLILGKTS